MFRPKCLPILIGSLPLTDHEEAMRQILHATPEIPLWPQLPKNPREGMVRQFLDGFPGLVETDGRFWIDTERSDYTADMTSFYEDCLQAESAANLDELPRFGLSGNTAAGFSVLLDTLNRDIETLTVKGQITGPITVGIAVKDQQGLPILYSENPRDMLVRLLGFKARWQIEQLKPYTNKIPPIIFIDEPGIVSFGSTAFAGVTRELVTSTMGEIVQAIQTYGGLAGIHICANGDWSPALESGTDIISFDAYSFFENFILFREQLRAYLNKGGILAWGIIPTGDPDAVAQATLEQLHSRWHAQVRKLCSFGIDQTRLLEQTLIAPACGTGSLSVSLADKVLHLTRRLSLLIREECGFA